MLPTGSPRTSVIAALAIALAATLLIVLAVVPTAFAAPRGPGRDVGVRRTSTRRLLLEGMVVVLAIVGAYVLRDRGIGSVASTGDAPASDPLIAAVPALAGLAAGLILVRLLPIPSGCWAGWPAGGGTSCPSSRCVAPPEAGAPGPCCSS